MSYDELLMVRDASDDLMRQSLALILSQEGLGKSRAFPTHTTVFATEKKDNSLF